PQTDFPGVHTRPHPVSVVQGRDVPATIFLYGFEDCVTDSVRCMDKPEEAKRNITRLADRKIWDRLMADTGMYTFMS
ncbi:hypothetical protein BMT61_26570, partial [Escherichia coli]